MKKYKNIKNILKLVKEKKFIFFNKTFIWYIFNFLL